MPFAAGYERELKDILQGDPETVRRYARALPPEDRPILDGVRRHPFLVIRSAGSHGFDLVALRREIAFPMEVKASASATIHFSSGGGRAAQQLAAHRRSVNKVGLAVLYAYRRLGHRGGDPWRLFMPDAPQTGGLVGLLRRRLPPVATTREGNAMLRWEDGMPLVRFVELMSKLVEAPRGG